RTVRRDMRKPRRILAALATVAIAVVASLAVAQPSYADGPFGLINPASGRLGGVQLPPWDTGTDVQLITGPCSGAATEHWTYVPLGNNQYHIVNAGTGNCMRALSNRDFAVVDTIDCTSISNEKWKIPTLPNPLSLFQIKSEISTGGEPCLDVQG